MGLKYHLDQDLLAFPLQKSLNIGILNKSKGPSQMAFKQHVWSTVIVLRTQDDTWNTEEFNKHPLNE